MSSLIKRFLFWLIIILFLEFSFLFIIYKGFEIEEVINILLHSTILSSFLSIITGLFKEKINKISSSIILFIIGILFSTQIVFYNTFKVFFSFSNLGLADQAASFLDQTFGAILNNIIYILLFMIPFIVCLIIYKKFKFKKNDKKNYIFYLIIIVLFSLLYFINVYSTKDKLNKSYYLYHNINEISLNIKKFGVIHSYNIDLYRLIFGFNVELTNNIYEIEEVIEEKEIVYEPNILDLNFNKETSDNNIIKINNYISNDSGTMKNEYTGLFKDYNLIYITAESFSEIGVSEELTPTLYKLINSGFIFDNFYGPHVLSTIGGEFQSLTGLYPDTSILTRWRSGTNYFPYGLGTVFKSLGYDTFAYHNNYYGFQDRHKYLKSQGFDNYLACFNGLEKRINCNRWPESDVEMIDKTVDDYINSDRFLAYYMTVSGHFEYTFSDNSIAYKNRNLVSGLNLSESAKSYVATQIELDRALELLINKLEENNKLDNTLIVLLADHYPYELDKEAINSLSTYERDDIVEVNKNALIIWNNKLEDVHIEKVCMSVDVLPTVYNLFGISYDSRLFAGRDILSTNPGLAIFRNHSFVSDYGTYFSNNNQFDKKKDIPDDYIENINNLINNRLSISKLILDTNYYNYLFN